jgi:hypothetical protein
VEARGQFRKFTQKVCYVSLVGIWQIRKLLPSGLKHRLQKEMRNTGYRLAPYSGVDFHEHQLAVYAYLCDFFDELANIPGMVVECGYGYGQSFLCLASISNKDERDLWAFDSFQGFPDPTQEDFSQRDAKKGEWDVRTLLEAEEQIQRFGLPPTYVKNKVRLIPGFVEDTLHNNLPLTPIAFLHIDLDLYSAYKCTLEQLFPLVAEGGIVLFDEYEYNQTWPGAKLAVDEYFKNLSFTVLQHKSGKYYVRKTSK